MIGGYRDRYRTLGDGERPEFGRDPHTFAWIRYKVGLPVDSTGQTPDGQQFTDIRELKQILLNDKHTITRGLTEKLATYALGRQLGFSDRPQVEKIVSSVAQKNYGFRSLIHEIVQSEMFSKP